MKLLTSKKTWIVIGVLILLVVAGLVVRHYSNLVSENKDLKQSVSTSKAINDSLTDQQRAISGTVDRQAQITIQVQREGEKIKEEIRNEQPKQDQKVSPRVSAALRGAERLRSQQ